MEKQQLVNSFGEAMELVWINIKVSLKNLFEYSKVTFRYYRNFSFAKADVALSLMYIFDNPYSISKRFLMKQDADNIYTYGETPLTTMQKIADECQIQKEDIVFELGCGRGRTCFWLHYLKGCNVTGIEHIREFVVRANRIKRNLKIDGVNFIEGNFLESSYQGATVLYLYGSTLEDNEITKFAEKCSQLPVGTKIITVSYPLNAYSKTNDLVVMKRFTASFTWGDTDVYLHIKK